MTKKILLITSDESLCNTLRSWFTQCNYEIVLATQGGDEGILLAVTEAPDIILIDTDLPVISGWQTIKILKASTVTQKIPIVALTVCTTEAERTKVQKSGCDACELKPVDLQSILATVKTLLGPVPIASETTNSLLFPNPSRLSQGLLSASQNQVVYIEDSPLDSQAMAAIIQGAGYGYQNISKPLETMPRLLEFRPQLIFLDLVMPYTNGYELCAQIRRTASLRRTPVIMVTSNNGLIDRVRARLVGASGFFSKPVKKEKILKVLNKYLASNDQHLAERSYQGEFLKLVGLG
ncbi:response regulator [Leptothoe sp. LEGE 181152]|nr:response regulator [Leptothoe sp. LEGE 181152]